jgi:hypothetical protein
MKGPGRATYPALTREERRAVLIAEGIIQPDARHSAPRCDFPGCTWRACSTIAGGPNWCPTHMPEFQQYLTDASQRAATKGREP